MFTNNKWWVWKTTSCYNIASMFAKNWFKTVMIDLDSQCNLSRLALWEDFFENDELKTKDIYAVLKWVIQWKADVDFNVEFTKIWENLSLLPWNIKLSEFESILSNAYNEAASWLERWFFISSAIDRFLRRKWLYEEIDLFIIDTNPSLSVLNKTIFLWTNYFVVPMNPDAFNHQWIENLWNFFTNEKRNWQLSWKVIWKEKEIAWNEILEAEALFIWYFINSYNVYNKKPISSQSRWIEKLPEQVKKNLSYKHWRNWLVEISYKEKIWYIQDYWQLSTLSQESLKAIFEITEKEAKLIWTIDNLNKAKEEFQILYDEILKRLKMW
jgi:cellulose biosynthesis protein BcsQ